VLVKDCAETATTAVMKHTESASRQVVLSGVDRSNAGQVKQLEGGPFSPGP
jgi:hypothetical protein